MSNIHLVLQNISLYFPNLKENHLHMCVRLCACLYLRKRERENKTIVTSYSSCLLAKYRKIIIYQRILIYLDKESVLILIITRMLIYFHFMAPGLYAYIVFQCIRIETKYILKNENQQHKIIPPSFFMSVFFIIFLSFNTYFYALGGTVE